MKFKAINSLFARRLFFNQAALPATIKNVISHSAEIDPIKILKDATYEVSKMSTNPVLPPHFEIQSKPICMKSFILENDLKSILTDLLAETVKNNSKNITIQAIDGPKDLIFHIQNEAPDHSLSKIDTTLPRLKVIKERVKMLNGDLEVVPMQGKGVNFYLFLSKSH